MYKLCVELEKVGILILTTVLNSQHYNHLINLSDLVINYSFLI